ncbi:MAG: hypothetical protein FWB76_06695 [Oscillospiraceae bacterium]|nr:hypothetical protein [Oscillospiraceae bacterium]
MKRTLALVLALVLGITMLGITASATTADATIQIATVDFQGIAASVDSPDYDELFDNALVEIFRVAITQYPASLLFLDGYLLEIYFFDMFEALDDAAALALLLTLMQLEMRMPQLAFDAVDFEAALDQWVAELTVWLAEAHTALYPFFSADVLAAQAAFSSTELIRVFYLDMTVAERNALLAENNINWENDMVVYIVAGDWAALAALFNAAGAVLVEYAEETGVELPEWLIAQFAAEVRGSIWPNVLAIVGIVILVVINAVAIFSFLRIVFR